MLFVQEGGHTDFSNVMLIDTFDYSPTENATHFAQKRLFAIVHIEFVSGPSNAT